MFDTTNVCADTLVTSILVWDRKMDFLHIGCYLKDVLFGDVYSFRKASEVVVGYHSFFDALHPNFPRILYCAPHLRLSDTVR